MKLRRTAVGVVLSSLALMSLGIPGVAAGGGTTRIVDDDGAASAASCDAASAAFSTIQSAVNASGPGDRVLVCPGTYEESVTVDASKDGLQIVARPFWQATIRRAVTLAAHVPLVHVQSGADDVTLKGFKIVFPSSDACDGETGTAVFIEGLRAIVRSNRIYTLRPNTIGSCG